MERIARESNARENGFTKEVEERGRELSRRRKEAEDKYKALSENTNRLKGFVEELRRDNQQQLVGFEEERTSYKQRLAQLKEHAQEVEREQREAEEKLSDQRAQSNEAIRQLREEGATRTARHVNLLQKLQHINKQLIHEHSVICTEYNALFIEFGRLCESVDTLKANISTPIVRWHADVRGAMRGVKENHVHLLNNFIDISEQEEERKIAQEEERSKILMLEDQVCNRDIIQI